MFIVLSVNICYNRCRQGEWSHDCLYRGWRDESKNQVDPDQYISLFPACLSIGTFDWSCHLVYTVFRNGNGITKEIEARAPFLIVMWLILVAEMVMRFFPSKLESPGCQKQFKRNYIRTGKTSYSIQDNHATMLVALIWVILNGIFGGLYMSGILDDGMMLILCCVYFVCDMICVLFFCPFQTCFKKTSAAAPAVFITGTTQ